MCVFELDSLFYQFYLKKTTKNWFDDCSHEPNLEVSSLLHLCHPWAFPRPVVPKPKSLFRKEHKGRAILMNVGVLQRSEHLPL